MYILTYNQLYFSSLTLFNKSAERLNINITSLQYEQMGEHLNGSGLENTSESISAEAARFVICKSLSFDHECRVLQKRNTHFVNNF